MAILLLLALIAFPFAEIAVLIIVGGQIGLLATLALLALGFVAGILLIRLQGIATLFSVRAALERGEPPADALFHAACVVAAGLLLMVPGFLTDAMALALLSFLPFRNLIKAWLWRRAGQRRGGRHRGRGPMVIEGEYETVEDSERLHSPWRRDDGPDGNVPPSRD